jgi:rfaE bifunctional protein kinase chain/domain
MVSKKEIIASLDKCFDKKVLVIGDLMLDEYHWCSVNRISPEAPVPICRVNKTTLVPGGAGNVAKNIQALGCEAFLVGIIGMDSSGEKLMQVLLDANIKSDYLIKAKDRATILKSRVVAHHQHVVRVDREDSITIKRKNRNAIFNAISSCIDNSDIVLISDYLKGTLPDTLLQRIITLAKEKGLKVVIDPKGTDYKKYKGAFVLTPNFHEFETVVKKKIEKEEDVLNEGLKLIRKLNLEYLLVTRSEKGMSIISKQGDKIDISTKAKDVFDITGAGDTVIAVLSTCLAAGCSIEKAASIANYAAGVVVGKVGTSTTNIEEIKQYIAG